MQITDHPIHPLLIPFPIISFIGVWVTEVMWLTKEEGGWATASIWLLEVGLVTALLAVAAGMTDYLGDDRVRKIGGACSAASWSIATVLACGRSPRPPPYPSTFPLLTQTSAATGAELLMESKLVQSRWQLTGAGEN